jgi:hypothetical protein
VPSALAIAAWLLARQCAFADSSITAEENYLLFGKPWVAKPFALGRLFLEERSHANKLEFDLGCGLFDTLIEAQIWMETIDRCRARKAIRVIHAVAVQHSIIQSLADSPMAVLAPVVIEITRHLDPQLHGFDPACAKSPNKFFGSAHTSGVSLDGDDHGFDVIWNGVGDRGHEACGSCRPSAKAGIKMAAECGLDPFGNQETDLRRSQDHGGAGDFPYHLSGRIDRCLAAAIGH